MDFYQILEVDRQATETEIRSAFRRLAIKFHPDTSKEPDAAEKFKLVYMAYEILNDSFKRQLYDELLYRGMVGGQTTESAGRRYDQWRREAAGRAQAYSEMKYEEFEDTLLSRISFHSKQLLSFIIFFILLCLAMTMLMLGYYYIFVEKFNGSRLVGYLCSAFGLAIAYTCLRALYGVIQTWRR